MVDQPMAVVLNDGGGLVTLDAQGHLGGFKSLSQSYEELVRTVLTEQRARQAPLLADLAGKEGVTIVAHQNLKDRLANPPPGNNGQRPAPAPADALPKQVYTDRTTVAVGGRAPAQVVHIAAHTDTDSVVYFPDANVLAVGDTGAPNRYPNMALGGSIKGMIDGTQTYLNMANDQTKIIPGHAPVSTKAQFQAYHDMLVQIRDRVAKLKSEGKSVDEAVAAKPLADLQAKVNQTDMVSENLVRAVYAQV